MPSIRRARGGHHRWPRAPLHPAGAVLQPWLRHPLLPPQPPRISIAQVPCRRYNKKMTLSKPFASISGAKAPERVFCSQEGTPMDSEKVIKRDGEYVLHTYNPQPYCAGKRPRPARRRPRGPAVSGFYQRHWREQLGYCDLDWAEPFPSRPTSCSIPLTFTTPRPAASWPKSCASAPA